MKSKLNCSFKLVYFTLAFVLIQSALTFGYSLKQLTKPVDHAESPVWDSRTKSLFFVDMFNGKLNECDVDSGHVSSVQLNGTLTAVIPCESNENMFIVGLDKSVIEIIWNGSDHLEWMNGLTIVDTNTVRNRFNDGKADKDGRLWFGTMGFESRGKLQEIEKGSLYFMTSENIEMPEVAVKPVNISNGMAWNQHNDKFYFVDTGSDIITEFDYDEDCGDLSNPRVVFYTQDFSNEITGHPAGLTIDMDDNLWIAMYGGGVVLQYDPLEGRILRKISVPAKYVTSNCWGGDNYDILYITTSRYLLNKEERKKHPQAGSIFVVTGLETSGVPLFRSKIVNIF